MSTSLLAPTSQKPAVHQQRLVAAVLLLGQGDVTGIHTPLGLPPQQAKMHCHRWTLTLRALFRHQECGVCKAHHPFLMPIREDNSWPQGNNSFPRMKEDMPVSFSIQSGLLQSELCYGTWRMGGLNQAALGTAPPRREAVAYSPEAGNSWQLQALLEVVHVHHLSSSLPLPQVPEAKLPTPPMRWGQGHGVLWPSSHEQITALLPLPG